MSRAIYFDPIVETLRANPVLRHCGLRDEAIKLLLQASLSNQMPADWIDGKRAMPSESVAGVALLLGDVLDAIQAELDEPTRKLQLVTGAQA